MTDQTALDQSLSSLSDLSLIRPLDTVLTHIVAFAADTIPGASGAGLALIRTDRPDTVVASEEFVREVDKAQYRLNEGPCLSACETRHSQTTGSLGTDGRWPLFGSEAAQFGVFSALSLPLLLSNTLLGSINVYARSRDAFTAEAVRIGERMSSPAAVSVANAYLLVQHRERLESMTKGFTGQAAIHQAIGILMARTGKNAIESLDLMRSICRTNGRDLSALADELNHDPLVAIDGHDRTPAPTSNRVS